MGQSRNKSGVEFELKVCEEKGWTPCSTKPKLKWTGKGRSNWLKMDSLDLDPTQFKPILSKSTFEKCDAITQDGDKVEIKKYPKKKLMSSWSLFSEPIFCVKNWGDIPTIFNVFGSTSNVSHINKSNVKQYRDEIKELVTECATTNYNSFLSGVINNVGSEIIDRLKDGTIGIQCEDEFVPMENIEFRWKMVDGWLGFNRYTVQFKVIK